MILSVDNCILKDKKDITWSEKKKRSWLTISVSIPDLVLFGYTLEDAGPLPVLVRRLQWGVTLSTDQIVFFLVFFLVWCVVVVTCGGESYCRLSTARLPKDGWPSVPELSSGIYQLSWLHHTPNGVDWFSGSVNNHSKASATIKNYLWCMNYSS